MNTPSHCILNLVGLDSLFPAQARWAIALGAVLPDVPIFIFYAVAKGIYRLPEREIWSQAYYEPFWQNLVAWFHSFPLALLGLGAALAFGGQTAVAFCVSLIAHSLLDFPVHHDDAHRHFFPFSDYRFISPLSYWDPKHHGRLVALGELSLVLVASLTIFQQWRSLWVKGVVLLVNLFYLIGYARFYLF